jgi:hypothetical protein
MIAAHAIDHPDQEIDHARIFPRHLEHLRESYFVEHREQIADLLGDMLALLSDSGQTLEPEARARAQQALERLLAQGYCKKCAPPALGELLRERYS